jgi:hypothetical protein
MKMTTTTTFAEVPDVQIGTDWIVPGQLIGRLLPGDQVVWTCTRGVEIHEIVALFTLAGVPVAILRKAAGMAGAAGPTRTLGTFAVAGPHGAFRLTIVEPLPTDRVWMVTDSQILLTKRTSK